MLHLVASQSDVQSAKRVMEQERRQVAIDTGLQFVTIRCPRCTYEADECGVTMGSAEGKAVLAITKHIIDAHNGSAA